MLFFLQGGSFSPLLSCVQVIQSSRPHFGWWVTILWMNGIIGDASTQQCAEQLVRVVEGLPLVPGGLVLGLYDGNADPYLKV